MIIIHAGQKYDVVPVAKEAELKVLSALRGGVLEHLGSINHQLQPRCSGFQLYKTDGVSLLAAAVSCNSQHIDVAYWLNPYVITPL